VRSFLTAALLVPCAIAADGGPDPGFGSSGEGWITLPLPPPLTGSSEGVAVRAQADGRLVLLAEYSGGIGDLDDLLLLYRLLPDGSLDPSFGDGGIEAIQVFSQNWARGLEVLPTGEILLGLTRQVGGPEERDFVIGRRTPDGASDLGWGASGWASFGFPSIGTNSQLEAITVAADGSVVAVGHTWADASHAAATFARLTPFGTLDPLFGAGGRSSADLAGAAHDFGTTVATGVLAEPVEGSIVFVGRVFYSDPGPGAFFYSALGRLIDGVFDPSFNVVGYRLDDFAALGADSFQRLLSVSRLADGSYIAAGDYWHSSQQQRSVLLHLLEDGTLDTGWGASGYSWFVFDFDPTSTSLLTRCRLDRAERSVCLGTLDDSQGGRQLALARIEGPLFDGRFGTGGIQLFDWIGTELAADLTFDANGRILVVGTSDSGSSSRAAVSRRLAGLPFADGFESGLLEAWSAAVPRAQGGGTVADQAEVSPSSKPSSKTSTSAR